MTLRQSIYNLLRQTNRMLFGWVKDRFPTTPWADLTRKVIETDQRQFPRSHAEKYELKTIWYWYPLYCLGGISFVAFILLTITGIVPGSTTSRTGGSPSRPRGSSRTPRTTR